MSLLTTTPPHGGPKEQCVSLKITQLMLHKFTVDENLDQREISVKRWSRLVHVTVFYINLRFYTTSFMEVLLMGTRTGGMD